MTVKNTGASVRARILNKAKAEQVSAQFLFTRYALERLLYRLAISEHCDHFLLKGALLFDLWYDVPLRPTRDIDLLGFGLAEIPYLFSVFEDLCAIEVADGIHFEPATIQAEEIRKHANYSGRRRGTEMPRSVPNGLSNQFATDKTRIALWGAFIKRNQLEAGTLESTVEFLRSQFDFVFDE